VGVLTPAPIGRVEFTPLDEKEFRSSEDIFLNLLTADAAANSRALESRAALRKEHFFQVKGVTLLRDEEGASFETPCDNDNNAAASHSALETSSV
jgi:hypothetical protein